MRLRLHPAVHFRNHDAPVSEALATPYTFTATGERWELTAPDRAAGAAAAPVRRAARASRSRRGPFADVAYAIEETRGYASAGRLYSPGHLRVDLAPGSDAALVASTEPWEAIGALDGEAALDAELERRHRLLDAAGRRTTTSPPS